MSDGKNEICNCSRPVIFSIIFSKTEHIDCWMQLGLFKTMSGWEL